MASIGREPLPAGAVIEYCGEHGEVIHDPGGEGRVTVKVGDHQAQWWWTFEGVTCSVVSLPTTACGSSEVAGLRHTGSQAEPLPQDDFPPASLGALFDGLGRS